MTLIEKLNGKKTTIGAILLFVATIPHIGDIIPSQIIDVLQYAGLALTGVGLGHKGIKLNLKKKKQHGQTNSSCN